MILELKIPRENESTPEAAVNLFSGFTKTISSPSFLKKLLRRPTNNASLALEIVCYNQQIHFFAVVDDSLLSFFESQFLAAYPTATLVKSKDYLASLKNQLFPACQIVPSAYYYYPFKTYKEFQDIDPLSNILAVMSKAKETDFFVFQIILSRAVSGWQQSIARLVEKGNIIDKEGTRQPLPGETLIKQKIAEIGLRAGLRLAANTPQNLAALSGTFAAYARGDGNSLQTQKPPAFAKKSFCQAIVNRLDRYTNRHQIFTVTELASLWHLPIGTLQIPNISWGTTVISEPPENLPTALDLSDADKEKICFFAATSFRNREAIFGIKEADRRRHIYIIGKSGTGKTTLISNMVIDDLKKGRGLAVVDPHGDLCETILDYIPSHRINDVCYFNPADRSNPISLNILEVTDPAQAELVSSGIIAIFSKLYGHSWGPRLEYILRNATLTLAGIPGSTLADILSILANSQFRNKALTKLNDPVLINFWKDEFEKMPDRLQKEAISPIQNKVGQFVSSPLIRAIIGQPKSSISLKDIMNDGKIILINLAQGRLGEDNSALLGAMLITKIQQAAMSRADIPEDQRRDFYLYVDEFQNFATTSFLKILSEARKYRLSLILANQYVAQIDLDVQKAIFGNAGTLISYVVGADDAALLEREYGGVFTQNQLVNLDRFQIATKLTIDSQISRPFLAHALPPLKSKNKNRDKVIRVSRQRFAYQKETPPTSSAPAPKTPSSR